jgi:hypothetical protein
MDGQTNEQTDRWTDGQTDRKAEVLTYGEIDIFIDKQKN